MFSSVQYGWRPRSSPRDDAGLFDEAFDSARRDRSFGLPDWVKEAGIERTAGRPLVFLGINEFTYTLLATVDKSRIDALVDDYRKGELVGGVPCITSDEFEARYAGSREILCVDCSRYGRAVLHFRGLAKRCGVQTVNFEQAVRMLEPTGLDYRVADHLPALLANEEGLRRLLSRMADELSRETLRRVVLYHLSTCRDFYRPIERPYETLYFRSGLFEPSAHERFVDCGASIGESIGGLLEITDFSIDRAWLIEPDRNNVATLEKLMARLVRDRGDLAQRLRLIPSAVGEAAGKVPFRHSGGHGGNVVTSLDPADGLVAEVDVVAIDDIVDASPTLIKMDVEGHELPALKGARRCIAEAKPTLCVSAYHRADDLVALSSYVLGLRDDYRVGLRHHTPLRWDTCLYFF